MKQENNTLEYYVAALLARSQMSSKELKKKIQDLFFTSEEAYLESMAKSDIFAIRSGKLIDNLSSRTESKFRSIVLGDQRLSKETREELERLLPYKKERAQSTLFLKR